MGTAGNGRQTPPLALADELGMRSLQAHCHRDLGTVYGQTGLLEQAHAELSTAIDRYREMEMTFWLPETEVALAQAGQGMTFEEILDQAAMLQRRGRVTYRALKAQFQIDDDLLETLKDELLFSHPVVDEDNRGVVWTGDPAMDVWLCAKWMPCSDSVSRR